MKMNQIRAAYPKGTKVKDARGLIGYINGYVKGDNGEAALRITMYTDNGRMQAYLFPESITVITTPSKL